MPAGVGFVDLDCVEHCFVAQDWLEQYALDHPHSPWKIHKNIGLQQNMSIESNKYYKNEQYNPPETRTVCIKGPVCIIGT